MRWAVSLLSLALWLSPALGAAADDRALFRLNGADYAPSQSSPGLQSALYGIGMASYQRLKKALDKELFQRYLE